MASSLAWSRLQKNYEEFDCNQQLLCSLMLDINTILSQQLEMHMNESQTLKYHLKVSVNLGSSMINIGSVCLIFSSMKCLCYDY